MIRSVRRKALRQCCNSICPHPARSQEESDGVSRNPEKFRPRRVRIKRRKRGEAIPFLTGSLLPVRNAESPEFIRLRSAGIHEMPMNQTAGIQQAGGNLRLFRFFTKTLPAKGFDQPAIDPVSEKSGMHTAEVLFQPKRSRRKRLCDSAAKSPDAE